MLRVRLPSLDVWRPVILDWREVRRRQSKDREQQIHIIYEYNCFAMRLPLWQRHLLAERSRENA